MRSQMTCALRYREECSKLSKVPPPCIVLWSRIGSWPSITFGGCRFAFQVKIWFMDQLRMLQKAKIIWDNDIVIQWLSDDMEFDVKFKITDEILDKEL